MRVVAVMIAHNEDWCIGFSARAALRYCDDLVVIDHGSTDGTREILDSVGSEVGRDRVLVMSLPYTPAQWNEMFHRQMSLEFARQLRAERVVIVDADEAVTWNLQSRARHLVEEAVVLPRSSIALPMVAPYHSLLARRVDGPWGKQSAVSWAFVDAPVASWAPTNGYHHHQRLPHGIVQGPRLSRVEGGIFHLQYTSLRRLQIKAAWYKVLETVRYPGRMTPQALNAMYDWTLREDGIELADIPDSWWSGYRGADGTVAYLDIHREPWQLQELRSMIAGHGRGVFAGLELYGCDE